MRAQLHFVARYARSASMGLGVLLGLALAAPAAAQVYIWTDDQGVRHYSNLAPPPSTFDVERREITTGPGAASNEPYALQAARREFPVKLYTTPTCGDACDQARAYLNERGIPFTEVSVVDRPRYDELKKVAGSAEVPVMRVGEETYRGYARSIFEKALDSAGYPAMGILPKRDQPAPAPPVPLAGKPAASGQKEPAPPLGPYAPGARTQRGQPGPKFEPEPGEEPQIPGPYAPGAPPQRRSSR